MKRALRKAGFEEHRFDTGDVIINYAAGPDNGPPLVLIPGQILSWETGKDFDHAEALGRVACPALLLHANWFRSDRHGLVGAMDDADVERVRSLLPDCRYVQIDTGHVIHMQKPDLYIREVTGFAAGLPA